MRTNWRVYLVALGVLLMVLPIWAKPKPDRTDTAQWSPMQMVMVGSTQVDPGVYTLRAEESGKTLEVLQNGKVVAETTGHWTQLPKKAANTEVLTDNNKITQIQFQGRTEALQIG